MNTTFVTFKRLLRTTALAAIAFTPLSHAATIHTLGPVPITGVVTKVEGATVSVTTRPGTDPVKIPLAEVSDVSFSWEDRRSPSPPPAPAATQAAASRPASAAPLKQVLLWHLELTNNDHLTGSIIDFTDARVTFGIDSIKNGTLAFPAENLRALWSDHSIDAQQQVRKAKDLKITAQAQDVAFIQKDNDVKAVAGLVTGLDDEYLHFKFEGEDHTIKLDRLVGILFAQREAAPDKSFYATLTFLNDDILSARITSMSDGIFHIAPIVQTSEAPSLDIPLNQLQKIETRNGRLVWLGDIAPASVSQTPFLDRVMPYQVDHSLSGGPLVLADGPVARGIAVHSRGVLTYDLHGQFERFHTKLGFQLPEGKLGRAKIRILGDDKILWQDDDLKGDAKPSVLDLDITGVKTLTLEVDYGKNQDIGDRIIWGDPRLIKPASN